MPPEVDWLSAWEVARDLSPYRAFPVAPSRVAAHWDVMSDGYESGTVGLIDERTWAILVDKDLVPSNGTVLDIGCGTGVLTERFARSGASVMGLDISPGMLAKARRRCAGCENATFVCQDWNAFSAAHGFDLVFSSFCPGVDGLSSILRMESMSRGTCCLVSMGHGPRDALAFDVWADIGGPRMSLSAYDPLFPYYALKELGRRPNLEEFSIPVDHHAAVQDVVEDTASFISLFQDLTDDDLRSVWRSVSARADGERVRWREERLVRVLYWSADVRNGPW